MIIDMRTYTLKLAANKPYFELYEKEGFPIQTKHLGEPFGYFSTEIGEVNQVVHMWKYESLADRDQRRAALQADPAWMAYQQKSKDFIVSQKNTILKPAPFMKL